MVDFIVEVQNHRYVEPEYREHRDMVGRCISCICQMRSVYIGLLSLLAFGQFVRADSVTNFQTEITISNATNVTLTCRWPAGGVPHNYIEASTSSNLLNGSWRYWNSWYVSDSDTNLVVTTNVQHSANRGFYRFSIWGDGDGDGLSNMSEESLYYTDPLLADSDGDGLPDDFEIARGTNPTNRDEWASIPKLTVGNGGNFATLAAACAAATTNAVIEIQPGVYSWTGVQLPAFPVLITSPDAGRDRRVVLRGTGNGGAILLVRDAVRSVIRGIYFDLGDSGMLAAVWVGSGSPVAGNGGSARIENCYFHMSRKVGAYSAGIYDYRYSKRLFKVCGCVFDAQGCENARGCYFYDANPAVVDHCSFLNFPPPDRDKSGAIFYYNTIQNYQGGDVVVPMAVKSCLFDSSFTNAYAVARYSGSSCYDVTLRDCLVPATNGLFLCDANLEDSIVGDAACSPYGILSSTSSAIDAGGPVDEIPFDVKGEARDASPDVGACEYVAGSDPDIDGDGLSVSRELELGTNPFLADTDADGVDDDEEMDQNTDPTDPLSRRVTIVAFATNTEWTASSFHTNYFGLGTTATGWDVEDAIPFEARLYSTNLLYDATNRAAKAFTDINGNGVFDVDEDVLISVPISFSPGCATVSVQLILGDVDGDQVGDARERAGGTDPYDAQNFRVVNQIEYTDLDTGAGASNYFAVADSEERLVFSAEHSFSDMFCTAPVDFTTTNGMVWVGCLRDLNGDGMYTVGTDVLYTTRLTGKNDAGDPVPVEMGDFDLDGVLDKEEYGEGTDPRDRSSHCCWMKVTIRGVFSTSNELTCAASWDGAAVGEPFSATNSVMTFDFGHRVSTNRTPAAVVFWDDANSNGVNEVEEPYVRMTFAIQGHNTAVTNVMQLGMFDSDSDGILDYWEQKYGVDHGSAADALRDDDGDGFINLHEYWAGTSPTNSVENGTGTVLRAAMDGVDERLLGNTGGLGSSYYTGYADLCRSHATPAAESFVANTNCWMAGVDLSCLSVWGSCWDQHSGRFWTFPVTVLSPWHVLAASHVGPTNNAVVIFRSASGALFERHVVAKRKIFGVADDDFMVGILDSPLQESIHPVRLLPSDYETYIAEGRRLPLVRIGRDKTCNIHDIIFLSPAGTRTRMSAVEYSTLAGRLDYRRGAWGFDSGHPNFLLVDGVIVYLYPTRGFYYSDYQATGYLCVPFYNRIQGAMDTLSRQRNAPRCTLQFYDFSRFNSLLHPGVSQ